MGIYDREYYRKEGPSYVEMLVPSGLVCKWLIVANVIVFLITELARGEAGAAVFEWGVLYMPYVAQGEVWRLLSYAFLHAGLGHILWNMLFLWWFGSDLEEMYGSREFLCFYLLSAVAGGLGYALEGFLVPAAWLSPSVGASGAVTALLVLCALHFPRRVILVMLILPVPIWLFALFSVLQDLLGLFQPRNPVAVAVHLGGAAFAAAYYHFGWRISSLWSGFTSWRRQRGRPKLRIWKPEEARQPVAVGAESAADEHLEAKLDAVLEKVARSGQESLTDQERQVLLRASEIYKKRRT